MPARRTLLALAALAGACAACARHPSPAQPAPRPSPARAPAPVPAPEPPLDLSGRWLYDATIGSSVITGTLTLVRSGVSYSGSATASTADESVTMRSMTVDGTRVVMLFETPDGDVRVEGTVTGGTLLNATVTLNDMTGRLRARKQP